MTDYRASDRDVSRAIRSWLHEDRHEDASRLAGAVLDRVETTSQRRATWWPAWRTPHMNKIIATGLGVAAVVALLLVGSTLFGFFGSRVGGPPSEPAVPSEPRSSVEPSGTGDGSLLVGVHVMDPVGGNDLIDDRVTVTIPAAGWFAAPDEGSITKDLGRFGLVTLVAVPGDHYKVPRNICDWQTDPGADGARIAESVGELVAYLTEQTYDLEGSLTRSTATCCRSDLAGADRAQASKVSSTPDSTGASLKCRWLV